MIPLFLFFIVISLLYPFLKCLKYPSANEKLNNAVAIWPTLAGAAIFFIPLHDFEHSDAWLLFKQIVPYFMIASSLALLLINKKRMEDR